MILSISSVMLVSLSASGQNYNIPDWIKNNAKWWSEGQIDDTAFVSGIQYLIQNGMMDVGNSNGLSENEATPENLFNVPVDKDAELPNGLEVEYNVLFVTSDDNCTWEEFGKMHFYNEVTYYYLLSWGLEPTQVDPICVPNTTLDSIPEEYFGNDLNIVITDEVIGQQHLLEDMHAWGYFQTPNLIVSGDLANIQAQEGLLTDADIASEWTLTHELAHFALYYVGEPEEIWVDWVHDTEDANEYCIDPDTLEDPVCNEIYDTIVVNGMEVFVMKPYAYYYYE
jgi:hypothetical protein